MSRGFFITGTDTGVGKTITAAAIIRALRARKINACGMKPIETGCHRVGSNLYPSDGMFLKNAAKMDENIKQITPYCFETPAAPLTAAEIEGRTVDVDVIVERFSDLLSRYRTVIVEGVGGLLVPIRKDYFVIDLVKKLDLPLIVVARPSLGTLSHTLLTAHYALKEGIKVSGIILNFSAPPDGTVGENTNSFVLRQVSPAPVLGTFPHLNSLDDESLERNALKNLNIEALVDEIESR